MEALAQAQATDGRLVLKGGMLRSRGVVSLLGATIQQNPQALQQTRSLDISDNGLDKEPLGLLGSFPALTDLDLSGNCLSQITEGLIGKLPRLHRLDLSRNALRSLPSKLQLLNSLQVLDVTANPALGRLPRELGALDHLYLVDYDPQTCWPGHEGQAFLGGLHTEQHGAAGFLQEEWRKGKALPPKQLVSVPMPDRPVPVAILSNREVEDAKAALAAAQQELTLADAQVDELQGKVVAAKARLIQIPDLLQAIEPQAPTPPSPATAPSVVDRLRGLKRQQLDEIRSLKNPPAAVQCCLEAIWLLLNARADAPHKELCVGGSPRSGDGSIRKPPWAKVQGMLASRGFITQVLTYDSSNLDDRLRKHVQSRYLEGGTAAKDVERASKACGPLWGWLETVLSEETLQGHPPFSSPEPSPSSPSTARASDLEAEQVLLQREVAATEEGLEMAEERVAAASKVLLCASRALQRARERDPASS